MFWPDFNCCPSKGGGDDAKDESVDSKDEGDDVEGAGVECEHHLCEERGEHLLVAAHVNASVQSVHLLLVLHQSVLEHITLDVEVLVLCLPGDRHRQRSQTNGHI